MKWIVLLVVLTLLTASCSNLFNAVVTPNQCKKCQVKEVNYNSVLFENEGCGGSNVRLEEEAIVEAYNLSRNGSLCDLVVECETWRQDPEGE